MHKSFILFAHHKLNEFGKFVINIFLFLPYFFSVSTLLKTLFYPWKNLLSKKTVAGFSFSELGSRFLFNFISRTIGFFMRLSILIFYFIFQTIFMILLPFISLVYFISIPYLYIFHLLARSEEEQKKIFKEKFLSEHLLKEENKNKVEGWFETFYQKNIDNKEWWSLTNLFSLPPLARDWAYGYTPILNEYAIDMASNSYLHHINNIFDRDEEIAEIELSLTKNADANVLIVGQEGVGKHTIIDALAKKIFLGKTNVHLMYKRILKVDMEKIGGDEKFFEQLLKEAFDAKNIILFIDNFDKYIERIDSIEKYGKSDQLQIIGMTTPYSYEKFISIDEKMTRLFTKIDVFEVSKEKALNILLEKVFDLENYHKIKITYEALIEAIEKSEFYLTYIPFPEKAVDLLDTACVKARSNLSKKPVLKVTPEIIDTILTEKTHIPMTITSQMKEKLLNLESLLSSQIFEQDEAIVKLSASLRRSFLLIGKRKKPLATFLFLGPTGVGKTATAKAIANVFFSTENQSLITSRHLIRFDMSNYQTKYDIPKLVGDSNSNEPGLLASAIREQPFGVLLLDEIEKADKDLLNIFLTVIDEGYFTDGFGKAVDCKNLVIVATSNAKNESVFQPEFLNRFDGVITFNELSKNTLKLITNKILENLTKDIYQMYKVKLKIDEKTINSLIEKGYDPRYGARNMERVIRDDVEDKIAKLILEDKVKTGETILL